MRRYILVMTSAFVLVGCGAEPGAAEVREALYKEIESFAGKEAAQAQDVELKKLEVLGCKKADSNGYVCDWMGPLGRGSGRIAKSASGWVLVGMGSN